MAETFSGFPKDFFAFFKELKAHNERAWFEANKQRYRDSVQAPMSAFIAAMEPRLKKISRHFVADPKPVGGSMFRIHRDIRFSKDKRPYKENAGCYFHHAAGKDVHAPGFYMHFAPGEVRFGGGLWLPASDALAKVRQAIAEKPSAWKKALADKSYAKHFDGIAGEALSRPPKGFAPDHPLIEDIKKKSFFAVRRVDDKLVTSPKLVDEVAGTLAAASPVMRFLCSALGLPF